MSSVESNLRTVLITAVAPVVWGTTYLTTERLLPPDRPLLAAAVRALPAGLVLLALRRKRPHGEWWWKAAVLGVVNIGLFFPLLFAAAYLLPGGLAATVQASSPLVVMALAFLLLGERATGLRVAAGVLGLAGVSLLVLKNPGQLSLIGLLAAVGSVLVSALGFVLVRRWPAPVDLVTLVSWQLVAGGVVLAPLALLVEGPPPGLDLGAGLGYLWLAAAGSVLAYVCWFHGLTHLPVGTVALVGLLNPVVATGLGVAFAGEAFGLPTAVGLALVLVGVVLGQDLRRTRSRRAAPASTSTAPATPAGSSVAEPPASGRVPVGVGPVEGALGR